MHGYILILLVGLLGAGSLYALSVDTEERSQIGRAATQEQQAGKYKFDEKSQNNTAPPVSTFRPTERISADSAVSFPVDI